MIFTSMWMMNGLIDDVMETDDYRYYSAMPKDQIQAEINELEKVIYQDCFENFYHLILEGKIELLTENYLSTP